MNIQEFHCYVKEDVSLFIISLLSACQESTAVSTCLYKSHRAKAKCDMGLKNRKLLHSQKKLEREERGTVEFPRKSTDSFEIKHFYKAYIIPGSIF